MFKAKAGDCAPLRKLRTLRVVIGRLLGVISFGGHNPVPALFHSEIAVKLAHNRQLARLRPIIDEMSASRLLSARLP